MPDSAPALKRAFALSIFGSVTPAVIGAAGTVLAAANSASSAAPALMLAWTVLGYLTLSDFGLTRTASRGASAAPESRSNLVGALWKPSLGLSAGLSALVGVVLLVARHNAAMDGIWVLLAAPILTATQFPILGVLEATGRFGQIASYRILNAVFTFLVPAASLARGGPTVVWALQGMVAFRVAALVWLLRSADIDLLVALRAFAGRWRGGPGELSSSYGWIAISSVVGPLLLYADRVAVGMIAGTGRFWVFYVSLSELMMKTYIVPSALMSVVFPWLARNWRARSDLVRRVFGSILPAATVPLMVLAAGVSVVAIEHGGVLAIRYQVVAPNLWVIDAVLAGFTVLNWSSQAYIGLLQAMGRQRFVATAQLWTAIPYLLALGVAWGLSSGVGIALAWAGRIGCVAALLWLTSRISLKPFLGAVSEMDRSFTEGVRQATPSATLE